MTEKAESDCLLELVLKCPYPEIKARGKDVCGSQCPERLWRIRKFRERIKEDETYRGGDPDKE